MSQELEYAALKGGLDVEVFSGGQHEHGLRTGSHRHDEGGAADLKLRDPTTGQLLDMRKPEDAARMRQFVSSAVHAGATGVGAGVGYMGPSSMHVGGGHPASWGGAPWIEQARREGVERGQMDPQELQASLAQLRAQRDRAALDRGMGSEISHKVEGTGKLTVDVNAPAGTKVAAEGGGMFKHVETNRQTQMATAAEGPATAG